MSSTNYVDVAWLAKEGATIGGPSTPQYPLIIGGSGALGSNLMVLLAHTKQCKRIRVLDMWPPDSTLTTPLPTPIEFIKHRLGTGSMEELSAAITGTDCVFIAVTPDVQFATAKQFDDTNRLGVKAIIKACVDASVARVVLSSSIAVSNHFVHSVNHSESSPLGPLEVYTSPYDISKRLGESLVLEAARNGDIAGCSLRFGGIMSSHKDFIFRFAFRFPGLVISPSRSSSRDIDFMDVRDACRALLMAAHGLSVKCSEVSGEAFYASKGERMRTRDFCEVCAQHLGYPYVPVGHFVMAVARAQAGLMYYLKRALGLEVPGIPPHKFVTMCYFEQTFDNSKIQRVLGFHSKVPMSETFKRVATMRLQDEGQFYSWSQAGLWSLCAMGMLVGLNMSFRTLGKISK